MPLKLIRPNPERALLITNPVFRQSAFGSHHPLSIMRHSVMLDLARMLGWLEPERCRICAPATRQILVRFHDEGYLDAFARAAASGKVSAKERERFGLGTMENPIFPGLWERAAATVGGAVLAAELALEGYLAFHPAGGTHHGQPGRASGFCYFNDPVFAILTLLDGGATRVVYVDLDAHHGDGVEDAFASDPRVMTISIHEAGRWPYSGALEDRREGRARNLPVPAGFNDSELDFLMRTVVLPEARAFGPDAIVITTGADELAGDPLSGLMLSNGALWRAVDELVALAPAAAVLGGGGYNPWTVARAWAGLWGRLSGRAIPERLPEAASAMLGRLESDLIDDDEIAPHWLTTLADPPNEGPIRAEIAAMPAAFGRL